MPIACSLSFYMVLCSASSFQLIMEIYFQSVKKILRNEILWKKLRKKNLDVVFNVCVSETRKVLTELMRGSCHINYTDVKAVVFLTRVSG